MISPEPAAATAKLIVGYAGVRSLQFVALPNPSRSTTRVGSAVNEATGRAAVGVSIRSQAAPRYAVAGKVRIATALRSVCIDLLHESRDALYNRRRRHSEPRQS